MGKSATLNLRVNPAVKERAEKSIVSVRCSYVNSDWYVFESNSLTGGIPFSVSLPKAPVSIHADGMTAEEIHQKLEKGYNDIAAGRVQKCNGSVRKI